jgi:FAD:protein FMN transferase
MRKGDKMSQNVKKLIFPILLTSLISVFFITGCKSNLKGTNERNEPVSKTEVLLGTVCTLKIYDKPEESIFQQAFNRIREIEDKMSINKESSEVIEVNNAAGVKPVKVSEDTFYTIKKGMEYAELSRGNYDISIGPLVKLWGIGTDRARVPSKEEIEVGKALINYKDVVLDENSKTVMLNKKNMILDLGGIAKGFAADEVAKIFRQNGVEHAIINLGGNVLTVGNNVNGTLWRIGVQNPFSDNRGNIIGIVEVADKTVTTAGIYERYFEMNGVKYHHILNPFTGYPADNEVAGITIITDKSIDGDGIDTGVLLMGLNKGLDYVNSRNDMEAIFVTKNKEVYVTKGLKGKFKLSVTDFVLKN